MAKSFTLNQLTEGIRERNVGTEGRRLTESGQEQDFLEVLGITTRRRCLVS